MSWDALKQKLSHAFGVDPPGPAEPNDAQRVVIERICREVVRRHLTTPALAFLQMSQPLNFLASQAMHFFTPIVSAVTDAAGFEQFAAFLEHRGSIDYICGRLEALEQEATARERGHADDASEPRGIEPRRQQGRAFEDCLRCDSDTERVSTTD